MQKNSPILLFLLSLILSINVNAQTYTDFFSNDKYKVKEFSDCTPDVTIIENKDDTIWITFADAANPSNCRIMSLDKSLNIVSNTLINYTASVSNIVSYKINDKFYGIYYTHYSDTKWDTLQLRCFDRDGNNLIDKDLWIKSDDDTLWINKGFHLMRLSNDNFFIIANACYPSTNTAEYPYASDAVRCMLVDTLGNIIRTKTYPLKTNVNSMNICEVGNHIVIDKVPLSLYGIPTGEFSNYGMTIIDKETLEIEDSIPRGPTFEPNELKFMTYNKYALTGINDSIFAAITDVGGRLRLYIININTKETIDSIKYIVEGGDSVYPPSPGSVEADVNAGVIFSRNLFSFVNPDSIYVQYFTGYSLELLNFSKSGNINFTYRIDSLKTPLFTLRGIKATQDGGVFTSIFAFNSSGKRVVYLIKFHPDGLIGLTNIETGDKESIKVYPNPGKDYIYVDIEASNFKSSDIELFDMQGRLVKKAKLKSKLGNRINVSNLNAGAYTYNVSVNGKTISGKVIVGK